MKKLLTLIILISSFAQAQFYEIIYETQVQTFYTEKGIEFWKEWTENDKELESVLELNRNPPKEQFQFIYNDELSKVVYIPRVSNSQSKDDIMIRKLPYNINGDLINNYKEKQFSYEMDVYGKKYLVKDNLFEIDLKDTGKTKYIIGYEAFEAIAKKDSIDIVVWYTKQLPSSYSPDIYYTTKGFILELHYKISNDESEMINSWLAINKKELKKTPKIIRPVKGIEIRQNQVDKIWEEANDIINNMDNEGIDKKD